MIGCSLSQNRIIEELGVGEHPGCLRASTGGRSLRRWIQLLEPLRGQFAVRDLKGQANL